MIITSAKDISFRMRSAINRF